MGVSQSKNVASAVQNVSNYVDNTTSANSDQVAQLEQTITNDNCLISLSEDYNIKTSANLSIKK